VVESYDETTLDLQAGSLGSVFWAKHNTGVIRTNEAINWNVLMV
jgi:hypothetical protein